MNNKTQQPTELTVHETPQDDASALIARAIDKNVSVDVMERLLTIRRELKQEKAKEAYDRDMAHLQSQFPIIAKNQRAGSGNFTYNYAPLEYIVEKVKSVISENGFSYTFDTEQNDKAMKIFCKVKHKDGHMEISSFQLAIDTSARMNSSQQYGAALTYGKRYAFCNAFGIVIGGEDTDAQTHTQQVPQYQQKRLESYPTPPVREENGLTYEPTDDAQIQQPANLYAGKSLAALKVEISQLMHQGKIEKDFAKLGKLTREEAIEILQKVGK